MFCVLGSYTLYWGGYPLVRDSALRVLEVAGLTWVCDSLGTCCQHCAAEPEGGVVYVFVLVSKALRHISTNHYTSMPHTAQYGWSLKI